MAGGTGGHVFPALAVAQDLQKKGWDVQWLGTQAGLEATIVPKANLPLHIISVKGLKGSGWIRWCCAPFSLLKACFQAARIFLNVKPTLAIGMGGFASGPGGVVAWLFRYPLLIHEQNALAGLTNRCLLPVATRVLAGFPDAFGTQKKVVCTGNPVRSDLLNLDSPSVRLNNREGPIRLLVIGGSRGALALNEVLPSALAQMAEEQRPDIWHQTGANRERSTQSAYEKLGINATVSAFIENMSEAYLWADFVVCRAGALTIAELSAVGIGSLLVPYPYAADDHQTHNARFLERVGAAKIMPQAEMTPSKLADLLSRLFVDRSKLRQMAEAAYTVAKRNALIDMSLYCEEMGNDAYKKIRT